MRLRVVALVVPTALVLAGCSAGAAPPAWTFQPAASASPSVLPAAPVASVGAADPTPAASFDHQAHHPFTAPSDLPTDPDVGDGEVAVVMTDAMRFEPGSITAPAGEDVTFVVTNAGVLPHEFFVGDEDAQAHHAAEMAAAGSGHAHHDALRLEAGETGRITMRFDAAGEFLVGCHEPGHYQAGMVGSVVVVD